MSTTSPTNVISFLKQVALFKDFSDDNLISILPFLRFKTFEKGEWVIEEGDIGQDIYIIKSGKVEIVKKEKNIASSPQLAVLGPGEWVGEMGHFEQGKRSASIRALEKVEVIIILLQKLSSSELEHLFYPKIVRNLSKGISQRLRKTDDILISSLSEKLKLSTDRYEFGNMLIHMMVTIALLVNLGKVVAPHPENFPVLYQVFPSFIIMLFGFSAFWLISTSAYSPSYYGLTTKNWLRNIVEAIIFTIPILILITLMKVLFVNGFSEFKNTPIFEFTPKHQSLESYLGVGLLYMLLAPIEELVTRSFLQSCLRNVFHGSYRIFFAILTSNLLFEMAHTVNTISFAVCSFFLGVFWGYLFERQKSIIGVCVSHIIVGAWMLLVMNILSICHILG